MPSIDQLITILFLLLALAMVVWTFFPTLSMPPRVDVRSIVYLIIGLIVLYVIYVLVLRIVDAVGVH